MSELRLQRLQRLRAAWRAHLFMGGAEIVQRVCGRRAGVAGISRHAMIRGAASIVLAAAGPVYRSFGVWAAMVTLAVTPLYLIAFGLMVWLMITAALLLALPWIMAAVVCAVYLHQVRDEEELIDDIDRRSD